MESLSTSVRRFIPQECGLSHRRINQLVLLVATMAALALTSCDDEASEGSSGKNQETMQDSEEPQEKDRLSCLCFGLNEMDLVSYSERLGMGSDVNNQIPTSMSTKGQYCACVLETPRLVQELTVEAIGSLRKTKCITECERRSLQKCVNKINKSCRKACKEQGYKRSGLEACEDLCSSRETDSCFQHDFEWSCRNECKKSKRLAEKRKKEERKKRKEEQRKKKECKESPYISEVDDTGKDDCKCVKLKKAKKTKRGTLGMFNCDCCGGGPPLDDPACDGESCIVPYHPKSNHKEMPKSTGPRRRKIILPSRKCPNHDC